MSIKQFKIYAMHIISRSTYTGRLTSRWSLDDILTKPINKAEASIKK